MGDGGGQFFDYEGGDLFFGDGGEIYYGSGDDIFTGDGGYADFGDYFIYEEFTEGEFDALFNPEDYHPNDFGDFFDISTFEPGGYGDYGVVGDVFVDFGDHHDVYFGERSDEALDAEFFFAELLAEELELFGTDVILENLDNLDYQGAGELPPDVILEILNFGATDTLGDQEWIPGAHCLRES